METRISEIISEKEQIAKEVLEYKFQLDGLISFKRREEEIAGLRRKMTELTGFIDENEREKEVQSESIFQIMKMINVKGGQIPDYKTSSTITEMQVAVNAP